MNLSRHRTGIDWNWRIDAVIGLVLGFTALGHGFWVGALWPFLVGLGFAVSGWVARKYPGLALAGFWVSALVTFSESRAPLLPEILVSFWIAYCAARWGSKASLIGAGASIVVGALFVITLTMYWGLFYESPAMALVLGLVAAGGIGIPWALGLQQRATESSRAAQDRAIEAEVRHRIAAEALAEAEAEEARLSKVADLEAANAQLARDVHDVVGHSLAVILAQAEAAQFLREPDELHRSMANIAASSRRSLGEIREVLSRARGEGAGGAEGDLDQLIASLRGSGVDVVERTDGLPRALPPELEQVAYRVLQEMLTNAIRHGLAGGRIVVQRLWTDRLMLQVRNLASPEPNPQRDLGGAGIPGIRGRLEAVGGSFELLRHEAENGEMVVATAWLPLRAQR